MPRRDRRRTESSTAGRDPAPCCRVSATHHSTVDRRQKLTRTLFTAEGFMGGLPFAWLVAFNLLFVLFFGTFIYLVKHYSTEQNIPGLYFATIGIGTMTSVLITGIVLYTYGRELRLGPWLIYDKAKRILTLPRHRVTFEICETVCFELVTLQPNDLNSPTTDLRRVTQKAEKREVFDVLADVPHFSCIGTPFTADESVYSNSYRTAEQSSFCRLRMRRGTGALLSPISFTQTPY